MTKMINLINKLSIQELFPPWQKYSTRFGIDLEYDELITAQKKNRWQVEGRQPLMVTSHLSICADEIIFIMETGLLMSD